MAVLTSEGAGAARARVTGVDLARGLALFGMIAVHVFDLLDDDHEPTLTSLVASGRSAAIFALLAGVSLTFLSGGRHVVQGRQRTVATAGLVVRASLIGAIGLLLGFTDAVDVILPFYALMFLLAIPLLSVPPRGLAALSATLIAVGPVLLVVIARQGVEFGERADPNPITFLTEPLAVLGQLLFTGAYPVVVYLAFVCAGLAIGRLDLTSRRLAWRLIGGGAALAVAAQILSWVLLYPLGGLARLTAGAGDGHDVQAAGTELLWEPWQGTSWWYLGLASPHANTALDAVHVLGSAIAVLGACLLVTRIAAVRRVLRPVGTAGAMTLTIYTGHILVLQTEVLDDHLGLLYLLLVTGSLVFAVLWRRWQRQGPLEWLVSRASARARRAVGAVLDGRDRLDGRGAATDIQSRTWPSQDGVGQPNPAREGAVADGSVAARQDCLDPPS